jgi:L-ascorbate metabolism protein UlaG (beta-lactamase superfamily)
MRVRWHGQLAFALTGSANVFVDPFGDMSAASSRGVVWTYPAITDASAELLPITLEHRDHSAPECRHLPWFIVGVAV